METNEKNKDIENIKKWSVRILMAFGVLFKAIFPAYQLLTLSSSLVTANTVTEDKWFKKAITRNLRNFLLLSIFPLLFFGYASYSYTVNPRFAKATSVLTKSIFSMKFGYTKKIMVMISEDQVVKNLKRIGLGVLLANVCVFLLIREGNECIVGTRKLRKLIKKTGTFGAPESANYDKRLLLYTPKGILLDVTGKTPRDLINDEHLWIPMNIRVSDHMEHPDDRAIVFIKKGYALQAKYIYE